MTGVAGRNERAPLPATPSLPDAPSRLSALVRSPRALGAAALVYAALPALLREGGDGASRLRTLAASGALLGAIPAVALARRLAPRFRMATVMSGSLAGALVFVAAIARALGGGPRVSDILGVAVLFPALAYGAATTLALTALGAADEDR